MNKLSYQEALDFLYSFVDYGSERSDRYSPDVFELARIRRFLEELGNPQWDYPAVHIAGTKGKGSVASMIASTLQQAGYKTGLYTSPHLIEFTERIRIDGQEIAPEQVAKIIEDLRPLTEAEPQITTYELMTALAFQYFAEQAIDIGVFEVGLGGRLDSTNVVNPVVTVITSLSIDHTHLLGDTLAEIAAEKAGIIKQGIPTVSAPQKAEAERVLQRVTEQKDASLQIIGKDWQVEALDHSWDGQQFRLWRSGSSGRQDSMRLTIPLLGDHQLENAAVAFAALKQVEAAGFELSDQSYREGFAAVSWPGRFQLLGQEPALVVDSAHNGHSAERLRHTLEQYFPGRDIHMVFGASEDKEIRAMLTALAPVVRRVTMSQADHPRAADPDELKQMASAYPWQVSTMASVRQAVADALSEARPEDVVLVTGSLFIVGEVLATENEWPTEPIEVPPGEVA